MTQRLFLVRHGENPANVTGEFSHRVVDYSLNERGRRQAALAASALATQPLAAVYSSPLRRAYETAEAIAAPHRLPIIVLEELRELNVGELEASPPTKEAWEFHDSIIMAWIQGQIELPFPGGENFITLRERMHRALRRIAADGHPTAAVIGHGGIFGATLATYCEVPDIKSLWHNPNCAISEVLLHPSPEPRGTLVRWAACDHLQE